MEAAVVSPLTGNVGRGDPGPGEDALPTAVSIATALIDQATAHSA
jgi:hypothetical protein